MLMYVVSSEQCVCSIRLSVLGTCCIGIMCWSEYMLCIGMMCWIAYILCALWCVVMGMFYYGMISWSKFINSVLREAFSDEG